MSAGASNPEWIHESSLMGLTYWAYYKGKKGYEIYQYVGRIPDKSIFVFKSRNTPDHLFLGKDELYTETFKPFLLNLERISTDGTPS
jgi:hypothetical protein